MIPDRRSVLLGGAGLALLPSTSACTTRPGQAVAMPADMPFSSVAARGFESAAVRAQDIIAAHRATIGAPGFSAAVSIGGREVWNHVVGWADVARRIPVTRDTRFRIGSTSKSLTASTTARLVDQGLIDLGRPIGAYAPTLPKRWRALTLHQLHGHMSGLPGYENNFDLTGLWSSIKRDRHYDDVVQSLAEFDGAPLRSRPGEKYFSSSYDVVLASAVLQAATRTPYRDLLRREVLTPLGMGATGLDDIRALPPQRATFYDTTRDGVRPSRFVDLSGRYAAGGLLSTSSDLLRLADAWLGDTFLKPETVRTFWTPQRIATGEINAQSYALGWRSDRRVSSVFGREVWRVHHGGISTGAMSWLMLYPDMDLALAFNMNTEAESFEAFARPAARLAKLFVDVA